VSERALISWKEAELGTLADFRNGVNYTKDNFGSGIRVINVKDFQDYSVPKYEELDEINPEGVVSERNLLRENDMVFVRSNGNKELIGRSVMILSPPDELVTHSAFSIRARFTSNDVYPRFMSYVLRSGVIRQALSAQGSGTNISNLNQEILSRLLVPLPPLPTQRRIASILSSYDDLIENNTRRIAILEEMARRLYEEWFVHFRFPGHEDAPFIDTEHGRVPEGWETETLVEAAHLVMGQSPKSEFYNDTGEGLPFHQGVSDFGDYYPTDRLYCTVTNRLAEGGDILFSVRAPVGRINIATKQIVIGRGVSAMRSKEGHQVFLLSQLRHIFQEEDSMGNGAIFKAVTKKDMETLRLIRPAAGLTVKFENLASPMWKQIRTLTDKNANLRAQRDLLLPKLVSGEIDVSEAEETLEDAVA
jgi:type I restriction enzyme S subunit